MNKNVKSLIPPDAEQEKFRKAFRGCAEAERVSPKRSAFYVSWAQAFVRFLPEMPLMDRTGKDIEAFLASLRKRQGIAGWQIRQAEQALRTPAEAAGEDPLQTAHGRPQVSCDRVILGEVERRHPRWERRYDIRTVQ